MAEDFPDFTHAVRLLGVDGEGDLVTVLLDSAGNMGAILKGTTAAEALKAVKVDDAGQLYAVLRGADDVDVAVDASGFLAAILKGATAGESLKTLLVDDSGRIIMVPYGTTTVAGTATVTQAAKDREVQGAEGETLHTIAVDASGQIIMVPRGQSGYYMAVDANGYMTAVLKGAVDGALTTIGVDSNGRIEAFLLDAESQWGDVLRVGNADLAGRLGSPVTWDWRGNILYVHDFSTGYGPVIAQTAGAGASIVLGPTYGGFGGYALTMTGGSDGSRYARVQLSVGTNPSVRIGVAVRFAISTNTEYVQIQIQRQKGVGSPWAYGRIDVANGQLQVFKSTLAWQNVGAVDVNLSAFTYGWLKLVINQSTGYYERILYNDVEVDVSAYQCAAIETSIKGAIFAELQNTSRSGENDVVYLDQIVLTVNEPENA